MFDYNSTIPDSIRTDIQAHLRQIEAEEQVRIFYACESGSRAWGFPSANSDYDVRFLYVHPQNWYLTIDLERKRDVIERPINDLLDISGWDLRKSLQLFRKSNPPLFEWLQSSIIYHESASVASEYRALIPGYYSPRASLYHYLHMAEGNFRDYMKGEEVWIKKYFYVLRPLLAIKWIEADFGAVPMEFDILVNRLVDDPVVKHEIETLVEKKRAGNELDRGPRIAAISDFIDIELERVSSLQVEHHTPKPSIETLNTFFRRSITALWA